MFLFFICMKTLSFGISHTLYNNWFSEEKAKIKKSDVKSITFSLRNEELGEGIDEDEFETNWDIDNKGLKAFVTDNNEVIISYPEGDFLKAADYASYMFSFCDKIYSKSGDYDEEYTYELESNLISINNLDLLDTKEVTNMSYMFYGNVNLENLDVSSWDTSNVTDMSYMFSKLKWIKTISLINFDASKVKNIDYMFNDMLNIESINISSFNFKVLSSMQYLFYGCKKLKDINIKNLDLSFANNNEYMFGECENITKIDFSGVKVPKMMKCMFSNIKSERLEIINIDTKNVIDMQGLFCNCNNLKFLNIKSFDTSSVEDMNEMFSELENLESIDLSNFNTKKVRNMKSMFRYMKNLKELDLSNFDTSNVTDMTNMFSNCKSLKNLNVSSFNTSSVKDIYEIFYNLRSLDNLDISNFNIDNIFYKEKQDYYLDLSTKTLSKLKSIKINYDLLNKLKEFEELKSWDNPEGYLFIRKNDYLVHFEPKEILNIPDMYVKPNSSLKFNDKYDDYFDLNNEMSINYNNKYSFDGFYEDKDFTKKIYNHINIDKNDFTIYVKIMPRTFIVTFNTNGGTDVPSQVVGYEDKAIKPTEIPIKNLYTFEGWYTDNIKYFEEFDFNKPIKNDTEIYAKYRYTG